MRRLLPGIITFLCLACLSGCAFSDEIDMSKPNGEISAIWESNAASPSEDQAYDGYFLEQGWRYWYQTLTMPEKIWYEDIENILGSMGEKTELSKEGLNQGLTEENIDRIFQCVMMDHPEFFYLDGYVYSIGKLNENIEKISFSGTYNMDRKEAVARKKKIDAAANAILSGISADADDYEKIKYVYETIITQTEYDLSAPDNQNIYSVLVGKVSVCLGYAKTTQYLLNRLGVQCTVVSGMVQGGSLHGWNLVNSNGAYYYVDTTWGDASYFSEDERDLMPPNINYDYLCVTTEEIVQTHQFAAGMEMPACTSLDDNYYVREGAYFTTFSEEKLRELFAKASSDEARRVMLKCATPILYEQMKKKLIEDGNVFQYYDKVSGSVVYVQNEEQHSMTFWVTNS